MREKKPNNLKLRQILPLLVDEIIMLENTKGDQYKDKYGDKIDGLCISEFYGKREDYKKFLNYYVISIESVASFRNYTMRITITTNKPKGKE